MSSPGATLIYKIPSIVEPVDFTKLFQRPQPVEVELGSGDGSFLARYAHDHPEHNFLGVERLLGRLRKIDRKGLRSGLDNLRLVRIEASYFLEYLLPEKSVSALHVYFPDPWPKRKHRKNRLINERFPNLAVRILKAGGVVFLRTDDEDYFSQMTRVFAASETFMPIETPQVLREVITDFERNFLARGVQTLRAAYQVRG